MQLASEMAPCPESIWFAAAVPCIPLESVRYNPLKRKARVTFLIKESKEFEIVDGVFKRTGKEIKRRPKPAGHIFWARLQETKRLAESDTRESWSRDTWLSYKSELVALGWCRRCDDGSIAWIGPDGITFTDFQRKRHKGVSGKK